MNPKIYLKCNLFNEQEDARTVMETIRNGEESEPFSDELAAAMKRLWADPALNTATYSRRLEFHLHDSAKQSVSKIEIIQIVGVYYN